MSDYISKQEAIQKVTEVELQDGTFADAKIKIGAIKTLNEKEIIRKPFEKVVERLDALKKVEENRADECDENGFGDGEEIYSDGCSQGRFEAFGQSIQVVKEEGGIE